MPTLMRANVWSLVAELAGCASESEPIGERLNRVVRARTCRSVCVCARNGFGLQLRLVCCCCALCCVLLLSCLVRCFYD